jgi:hypothetical protein
MKEPKITMETLRTALTIIEECGGVSKFLGEDTPCRPSQSYTKQPTRLAVLNAVEDAAALEKIERSLSAINVRQCNGYCNERTGREDTATMNRDEKREESLQRKASEIARRIGLKLEFGGDPMGSAVRIITPRTGAYNSMGGAECGWYV